MHGCLLRKRMSGQNRARRAAEGGSLEEGESRSWLLGQTGQGKDSLT